MVCALKQKNYFLYMFLIILFIYIAKISFAFSNDSSEFIEAEKEILKQEKLVIARAEEDKKSQEAEEEKIRMKAEEYKLGQEQIVIGIRKNIVWTDLNIKYLLADISKFIDSHKSEIDILNFVKLYKPVKSVEKKLIANKNDIENIVALENFLLQYNPYKTVRFNAILERRAKELYKLDLSIKELEKVLEFSFESILSDPLDDKIYNLTILYDAYKKEKKYTNKIEVDEIIQKFKDELKRIGIKY